MNHAAEHSTVTGVAHPHRRRRMAVALALLASCLASGAAAQETVVLGLQSEDGDDDVARDLSDAVREQARLLTNWNMSDSSASLLQMTMAHDCDAKSDACLGKIASGLGASRLVLGTLRRGEGDQIQVEASLFDADSGSRSARAEASFAATESDAAALGAVARTLVEQLAGLESEAPEPAPVAAAESPADTEPEPVPASTLDEDWDESPPPEGGSSLTWLGYTLLGVAAVSAGMTVFSWLQIDNASSDASFEEYRRAVGREAPMVTDVCQEADAGQRHSVSEATFSAAVDQCNKGEAFELLQYVFLGTAVVSGGVGVWLVLDESGSESAARGSRLALTPRFGPDSAGLQADLRF